MRNSKLMEIAKGLNSNGIEFMEGRDKAELKLLCGNVLTITDFDFIKGEDGEYVVMIFEEDKNNFFFGGSIVTEKMKQLEEYKEDIQEEGLPVLFTWVKAKKKGKRDYMTCEFYPETTKENDEIPF